MIEGRTDMAAHAEWRDDETALIATKRAVAYAQASGHRLHVLHLTSGVEADWLNGITSLHGEEGKHTSPQRFFLSILLSTKRMWRSLELD